MPQRAKNPQHRYYFYPIEPPEDVFDWESWPTYNVCIPGPLISYLLNVMKVYQWEGRVKTDDPAEAKAFVGAWNDLIARVGASEECMPFPQFRMNPEDGCQTQQSLDGGETWVTIIDTSICQPVIPPMIRFRQNPSNSLQVQQSHDGGSTWTLAFTFSAVPALSTGDTIYVTNVLNEQLTTITNTYNTAGDTVISIAPNFVYTGVEEEDDVRDILLCWACREVVKLSCEMVKEARARDAIGMQVSAFVLTVVGVVIAATGSVGTGGFGTPFFVGLGAAIAGLAGTLWTGISNEQLSNEDVREAVACCMYNALKGATPERSAFVNSLSGCDFEFGSVEAQMAGAIAASLDSDEMHASWLDYAQANYNAAQLGLLPDCPCEDEEPPDDTWCTLINFEESNGSAYGISADVSAPGVPTFSGFIWEPDVGLINDPSQEHDKCFGSADWSAYDIEKITMTWEYAAGTPATGNIWMGDDFGSLIPVGPPTVTHEKEFTEPMSNFIFGGEHAGDLFAEFIIIKSLKLEGHGENPFGADNCA